MSADYETPVVEGLTEPVAVRYDGSHPLLIPPPVRMESASVKTAPYPFEGPVEYRDYFINVFCKLKMLAYTRRRKRRTNNEDPKSPVYNTDDYENLAFPGPIAFVPGKKTMISKVLWNTINDADYGPGPFKLAEGDDRLEFADQEPLAKSYKVQVLWPAPVAKPETPKKTTGKADKTPPRPPAPPAPKGEKPENDGGPPNLP